MSRSNAQPPPDGDALLAVHYLPVMRLCLSRLRDPADAEDAAQETFRRAVQNAPGLRGDPLPWLLTVARNVCTDELRRRQRLAGLSVPDERAADPDPTPEGVVVGRLSAVELLGRLTPGERRAVAARMGAVAADPPATSTTRVLLARARDKVRRYLEDTQSAFGTATVSTTEALHQLRSRFAGRTLIGSGRAAVLIPAVLIIGAVGGPAAAPGTLAPAPAHAPALSAVMPGGDEAPQGRLGVRGSAVAGTLGNVAGLGGRIPAAAAPAGITLPPPAGPTWMTSLPGQDYHQVQTLAIQPSPDYATDHTVMMIGPNHNCADVQLCSVIYRSTDGGATWSFTTAEEATGQQLALPAGSFGAGTWWVTGKSGADRTDDGGASFSRVLPAASGFPMLPRHPGPLALIFSSAGELWGIRPDNSSVLLSVYAPGHLAESVPYLLDTPGGDVILQAVVPAVDDGHPQPLLERCTPGCGPAIPLPMTGPVAGIFASPHVATDHTLYINGLNVLAVSHDDGQSFTVQHTPGLAEAIAVPGPSGRRVAAVMNSGALAYSDDDGASWHQAAIPHSTLFNPHTITEIRPGRLIASMQRADDPGWYWFVCSADGSAWSLCTPDRG
jgi:Sigma-70 region 2